MRFIRLFTFFISFFHFFLLQSQSLGDFEEVSGSPFAVEPTCYSIAFSPLANGNLFAAVTNGGLENQTVSVYSVDQTTGFFTPVTGSPFATGNFPTCVAFSPMVSGHLFAAVGNGDSNNVSVYSVDQTTGFFPPVAGSPFPAGIRPDSIVFSPLANGNLFAAVGNGGSNNISVYAVDQTTGLFTPVAGSPFPAGINPTSVAFSPLASGNLFAAVANHSNNTVSVYSVNQTTGLFTSVAGSPFPIGSFPTSVAFSPLASGNLFAAVTNLTNNTVSVYSVNQTTGLFTSVTDSPFPTGRSPASVTFSPLANDSLFAAVTNEDGPTVSVYSVDQTTGLFTPVANSPFPTGDTPLSLAFSPLANGNLFAAVPSWNNRTLSVYNVVLPPAVTEITPSQGPSSGGIAVTITGAKFTENLSVLFGTTSASFTKDSETQITAISPPGSGTVNITVTTPVGTSATSANNQFTYISPPPPPADPEWSETIQIRNNKITYLDVLKWKAPTNDSFIVEYRVYRDKCLSRLVRTVPSNKNLRIIDLNRRNHNPVYYIVSVNIYGDISKPVQFKGKNSYKIDRSNNRMLYTRKGTSICHKK